MRRSSEASGAVSSAAASADGVADGSLAAAGATTTGASSAGADSASATSSSGSGSLSSASETHSAASAASSSSSSARYSSIPATAPLFHPQPSLPSLHLHDLFSQHRPLLLLDQPLANLFSPLQRSSSLFSSSTSSRDLPTSPDPFASLSESQARIEDAANARALSQLDFDTTAPADRSDKSAEAADEDVMRFLAHSLVQQKIQANNEWSAIERRLGLDTPAEVKDAQATEQVMVAAENESTPEFVVSLDSVKRKRRKKMNKHKYV
ncbi:hypothetical protein DL93DRAFT_1467120 [Clavulina sp. PMI_390]|nr:hypothetical protein DL93DRAFT_1467120 [Clavulina sp. PMI_390]